MTTVLYVSSLILGTFAVLFVLYGTAIIILVMIASPLDGDTVGSGSSLSVMAKARQFMKSIEMDGYSHDVLIAGHGFAVRYARGNVLFQNSLFKDDEELRNDSEIADCQISEMVQLMKIAHVH